MSEVAPSASVSFTIVSQKTNRPACQTCFLGAEQGWGCTQVNPGAKGRAVDSAPPPMERGTISASLLEETGVRDQGHVTKRGCAP